MSTDSDYLPGASQRANDQVRIYEATDGARPGTCAVYRSSS